MSLPIPGHHAALVSGAFSCLGTNLHLYAHLMSVRWSNMGNFFLQHVKRISFCISVPVIRFYREEGTFISRHLVTAS